LSFFQKAYCASFAGFIGSLCGNPADLALVRMQADNQLPLADRRNYKNVFDAFARITKE
jgi:solute carrier family 25 oxoglutarate transporter 11